MGKTYTAEILYDKDSIKTLEKMMNRTINLPTEIMRRVAAIAIVAAGLYRSGRTGMVLIAMGCILFGIGDVILNWRTGRSIDAMAKKSVLLKYAFTEEEFTTSCNEQEQSYKYSDMIRLVECESYLYIYPNRYQAFMVDRTSLCPDNEREFMELVSQKAGIAWTRPISLFASNIHQIIFNIKNTKKRR